eukprot:6182342-Pleurochrysis_carterae.AAC.7
MLPAFPHGADKADCGAIAAWKSLPMSGPLEVMHDTCVVFLGSICWPQRTWMLQDQAFKLLIPRIAIFSDNCFEGVQEQGVSRRHCQRSLPPSSRVDCVALGCNKQLQIHGI